MDKKATAGEPGRKKRRKRQHGKEFMDAALDGYIRDQALLLWRDFEIYRSRPGATLTAALRETGFFADREQYAPLWSAHWETMEHQAAQTPERDLFGLIETTVRQAVEAERASRLAAGDVPLEDLDDYNTFIRHTLNSLLAEDPSDKEGRR